MRIIKDTSIKHNLHCQTLSPPVLCFTATQAHMVWKEHHLRLNEESEKFESMPKLPVFEPKTLYLETFGCIAFFGRQDIITDTYQDSMYLCEIKEDGSSLL